MEDKTCLLHLVLLTYFTEFYFIELYFILISNCKFSCCNFCLLHLIVSSCTSEKSLALSFPYPLIKVVYGPRSPLSFPFSRLNRPSFLNFFSYVMYSRAWPCWWSCSSMLISLLFWETRNWTHYSWCNLTSAKNGKDDFPGPTGYFFLLVCSTTQLESFLKHGFKFL